MTFMRLFLRASYFWRWTTFTILESYIAILN